MKKLRITLNIGTGQHKDGTWISFGTLDCMRMRAEKFFLATCGGFSRIDGTGGWRESVDKGTVDWLETNVTYVLLADPGAVAVKPLAEWVRDNFEQKCIVVTTETVDCDFV